MNHEPWKVTKISPYYFDKIWWSVKIYLSNIYIKSHVKKIRLHVNLEKTKINPNELIANIILTLKPMWSWVFKKTSTCIFQKFKALQKSKSNWISLNQCIYSIYLYISCHYNTLDIAIILWNNSFIDNINTKFKMIHLFLRNVLYLWESI